MLMYHSAPESGSGSLLAVPRDLIDRQWAASRFEGWILRGLTEALALSQADPAARVVGLTFDDGYRDFLGVPDLLSKHEARATLYLPTADLDAPEHGDGLSAFWPEAASLPRDLVEVGSHAHVHRPLDVLPQADLYHEVQHSRQLIADRIGTEAASFCCPNGYRQPPRTPGRVRRGLLECLCHRTPPGESGRASLCRSSRPGDART